MRGLHFARLACKPSPAGRGGGRVAQQRAATLIGKTEASTVRSLLEPTVFAHVNDELSRCQGWHQAVSQYRRPMAALAPT